MLKERKERTKQDHIYLEDIKDLPMKVQWKINGLLGYQIFKKDNNSNNLGDKLDNQDITLKISDPVVNKKNLSREMGGYSYVPQKDYNGMIKYVYTSAYDS